MKLMSGHHLPHPSALPPPLLQPLRLWLLMPVVEIFAVNDLFEFESSQDAL